MQKTFSKSTVSGNASATVSFVNAAPVISSLVVGGKSVLITDCNYVAQPGSSINWIASNANWFELYLTDGYPKNNLLYSGTASSYSAAWFSMNNSSSGGTFLLRAFNGSAYSELQLYVPYSYECDTPTG